MSYSPSRTLCLMLYSPSYLWMYMVETLTNYGCLQTADAGVPDRPAKVPRVSRQNDTGNVVILIILFFTCIIHLYWDIMILISNVMHLWSSIRSNLIFVCLSENPNQILGNSGFVKYWSCISKLCRLVSNMKLLILMG